MQTTNSRCDSCRKYNNSRTCKEGININHENKLVLERKSDILIKRLEFNCNIKFFFLEHTVNIINSVEEVNIHSEQFVILLN